MAHMERILINSGFELRKFLKIMALFAVTSTVCII